MAVSKRLRYEIFRRDNHACRYCGGTAPDVPLRIDHVTPIALGGGDTPDNLVTACEPCNSGKTSTTPGAPLVADVAQDALRWSTAMQAAAVQISAQAAEAETYRNAFLAAWNQWTFGGKHRPLPDEWRPSIERFRIAGLPATVWIDTVDAAMSRNKVDDKFRYVCGVAWNKVNELQTIARQLLVEEEADDPQAPPSRASLLEAVVWAWASEQGDPGEEGWPTPERIAAFRSTVIPLLEEHALGVLAHGAAYAAWYGATDLAIGIAHAEHEDLAMRQHAAHDIWRLGWISYNGEEPPQDVSNNLWATCLKLYDLGAHPAEVSTAAAMAGLNGSVQLHCALSREECDAIGVNWYRQEAEEIWAMTWLDSSKRRQKPTPMDRIEFRAGLEALRSDGDYAVADVLAAAASAGAYQDTYLPPHLPRRGSVFKAAAEPFVRS